MAEWNGIEIGRRYLQMANAIHPEEAEARDHAARLALQDIYYQCYVNSFSRMTLVRFLQAAAEGQVTVPEEVDDERAYRTSYSAAARRLLDEQKGPA